MTAQREWRLPWPPKGPTGWQVPDKLVTYIMMGVMITVIVAFITDATLPPRRYYVLRQSFAYLTV